MHIQDRGEIALSLGRLAVQKAGSLGWGLQAAEEKIKESSSCILASFPLLLAGKLDPAVIIFTTAIPIHIPRGR